MWIFAILWMSVNAGSGTCKVLALGGGSDNGPYQAGAIIGLINNLPQGEAQWDVVTGIGAGALNGLMVAQSAIGQETKLSQTLTSFWTDFKTKLIYKEWFGGFLTGYYSRSGLFNSEPLVETTQSLNSGPFQRYFGVGATDLISGSYVIFNSTGQGSQNMNTGVLASFSDSGSFPLVPYKSLMLVSGSLKYAIDIVQGIKACHSMGYSDQNIVVDTILASGKVLEDKDVKNYRPLRALSRYREISSFENQMFFVENTEVSFPSVYFRSTILPSKGIRSPDEPYDFSKSQRTWQLSLGQEDAKKALGL